MKTSEQINEIAKDLCTAQECKSREEGFLIWKMSRHFKGKYKGNQNIKKTPFSRFFDKVCFGLSSCWYWSGSLDSGGYGMLGKNKAHRISWILFFGDIPEKTMVLHKCDIPICVNPEHLFLGNQAINMKNMQQKKRGKNGPPRKGEIHPLAILTNEKVQKMRDTRKHTGISYKKLAEEFNVTTMTAYRAVNKQSWSHI